MAGRTGPRAALPEPTPIGKLPSLRDLSIDRLQSGAGRVIKPWDGIKQSLGVGMPWITE